MNSVSCPWSTFTPDPYPFCEEHLCFWITQPANSWTNIGYFVVGWALLRNRDLSESRKLFGLAAIALGIGSTIFHVTGTLWAKHLDVGAMLLLSSLALTISVQRILRLSSTISGIFYFVLFVSSYSLVGYGRWGSILFLLHALCAVIIEFASPRKVTARTKKHLILSTFIFVVALVLNMGDQNGTLCIPTNHWLTVHGVWHLLSAYCIYRVSYYYCET